jgi:hypothetical protein
LEDIIFPISDQLNREFFRRNIFSKGIEGDRLKKSGLD